MHVPRTAFFLKNFHMQKNHGQRRPTKKYIYISTTRDYHPTLVSKSEIFSRVMRNENCALFIFQLIFPNHLNDLPNIRNSETQLSIIHPIILLQKVDSFDMQLRKQKPVDSSKMSSACLFCGETICKVQGNCICDIGNNLENSVQARVLDGQNVLKDNFVKSNCEESIKQKLRRNPIAIGKRRVRKSVKMMKKENGYRGSQNVEMKMIPK